MNISCHAENGNPPSMICQARGTRSGQSCATVHVVTEVASTTPLYPWAMSHSAGTATSMSSVYSTRMSVSEYVRWNVTTEMKKSVLLRAGVSVSTYGSASTFDTAAKAIVRSTVTV